MLGIVRNYLPVAKANEAVFRNILRDLKTKEVPYVPNDLETEAPLEEIFQRYSRGLKFQRFTITDFTVSEQAKQAKIDFEDVGFLSGGGLELEYLVDGDSVKFLRVAGSFMS